jgi:hypothetical protein
MKISIELPDDLSYEQADILFAFIAELETAVWDKCDHILSKEHCRMLDPPDLNEEHSCISAEELPW